MRVRRRSGWTAPVEVWAEGLPNGVVADRQTADAKDSIVKDTCGVERVIDGTIVLLPVRVEASPTGTFDFKIKGRGVMDGKTVEREAIVRYNHAIRRLRLRTDAGATGRVHRGGTTKSADHGSRQRRRREAR